MSETMDELVERLKRLDAAATKGPWCEDMEGAPPVYIVSGNPCNPKAIAVMAAETIDDGLLVVALRNALPALLAERERLREALRIIAIQEPSMAPSIARAALNQKGT